MAVHIEVTADRRFGTNSYLVEDDETHDAVVVDSNLEPELVIEVAKARGANVKAIVLTHTDIDHIAGLHELREAFGPVPIAVSAGVDPDTAVRCLGALAAGGFVDRCDTGWRVRPRR